MAWNLRIMSDYIITVNHKSLQCECPVLYQGFLFILAWKQINQESTWFSIFNFSKNGTFLELRFRLKRNRISFFLIQKFFSVLAIVLHLKQLRQRFGNMVETSATTKVGSKYTRHAREYRYGWWIVECFWFFQKVQILNFQEIVILFL